jgi:hypothetical protein
VRHGSLLPPTAAMRAQLAEAKAMLALLEGALGAAPR